jgi:hypothetical protein
MQWKSQNLKQPACVRTSIRLKLLAAYQIQPVMPRAGRDRLSSSCGIPYWSYINAPCINNTLCFKYWVPSHSSIISTKGWEWRLAQAYQSTNWIIDIWHMWWCYCLHEMNALLQFVKQGCLVIIPSTPWHLDSCHWSIICKIWHH